jgi:hypothetical protein
MTSILLFFTFKKGFFSCQASTMVKKQLVPTTSGYARQQPMKVKGLLSISY